MTKVRCFILMGGMAGPDGSAFSRGMVSLSQRINAIDGVMCSHHYWSSWSAVENQIKKLPKDLKTAVVGYSGGGSRLTWMNTEIDLAVGYDPSPTYQVWGVKNYERALCYHNTQVNYLLGFRLGGGQYRGANVETTEINMNHLAVQFAEELHLKTLAAIERLKIAIA